MLDDLDNDTLHDEDELARQVEQTPSFDMSRFTNYDYVQAKDGSIFILIGDRQPLGQLHGLPVYGEDPSGDRSFDGTTYSKYAWDSTASLESSFYANSPDEYRSYQFPVTAVEQHVSPLEDTEEALESLDDTERQVYRKVEDVVTDEGGELALLGSNLLGIETDGSDLDMAVISNEPMIDSVYERLQDRDDIDHTVEEASKRVTRKETKKGAYSTRTIKREYDVVKEMTELRMDGVEIDLLPTHEPGSWTDYPRISDDTELTSTDGLEGTIVDASQAHADPVRYTLDTGDDEVEVLTFLTIFKDAFEQGQDVTVYGDLDPEEAVVYLRDPDHFMEPSSSFFNRLLDRDSGAAITVREPEDDDTSSSDPLY